MNLLTVHYAAGLSQMQCELLHWNQETDCRAHSQAALNTDIFVRFMVLSVVTPLSGYETLLFRLLEEAGYSKTSNEGQGHNIPEHNNIYGNGRKGKGKGHPCTGTEALYRPYGR